jgi:hypothetical protein
MIAMPWWILVICLGTWTAAEALLILAWWDQQHDDEYDDVDGYDPWSDA